MLPPRLKKRATSKLNTSFITQVIIELEANPHKLEIIRHNLAYYRTQTHLKKAFSSLLSDLTGCLQHVITWMKFAHKLWPMTTLEIVLGVILFCSKVY